MGHCSVDVVYPWLNDWTRLQWALHSLHMQQASPFSAVRGGDALFPNEFGDDLFSVENEKYYFKI